ncbi:hypothetical protein DQ04_01351190 [Trypanosoma grayi]|uniref:hypothetical protein n=1 Tax=Trypanosoma grayi TaxID=71804 RepID=UPI0004F44C7E|nr:hypothetical protein DQ04_01351190 [Trypanosoma grayi]KEG12896.1 hypothetical protein DQ04_01351190 [Trypanosoma grayi]
MIVNAEKRTIDFSNNPTGKLDGEILTNLRDALNHNDSFCRLVFNNNQLAEDAIGILAAILKGRTPIEHLSLTSCNLHDVDVMLIANAVCARKVLKYLDLSKNPGITSASVPDIARMIRIIPSLQTVMLSGTSLEGRSCAKILDALERSQRLSVLELPYTVGFKILDSARNIIEKREKERPAAADKNVLAEDKVPVRRVLIGSLAENATDPWRRRLLPRLVPPQGDQTSRGSLAPSARPQNPANSLQMMEFRHWADPAVKNAAVHLHVLDKRCHLLEVHKQERRERIQARCGLGERAANTSLSTIHRL